MPGVHVYGTIGIVAGGRRRPGRRVARRREADGDIERFSSGLREVPDKRPDPCAASFVPACAVLFCLCFDITKLTHTIMYSAC